MREIESLNFSKCQFPGMKARRAAPLIPKSYSRDRRRVYLKVFFTNSSALCKCKIVCVYVFVCVPQENLTLGLSLCVKEGIMTLPSDL